MLSLNLANIESSVVNDFCFIGPNVKLVNSEVERFSKLTGNCYIINSKVSGVLDNIVMFNNSTENIPATYIKNNKLVSLRCNISGDITISDSIIGNKVKLNGDFKVCNSNIQEAHGLLNVNISNSYINCPRDLSLMVGNKDLDNVGITPLFYHYVDWNLPKIEFNPEEEFIELTPENFENYSDCDYLVLLAYMNTGNGLHIQKALRLSGEELKKEVENLKSLAGNHLIEWLSRVKEYTPVELEISECTASQDEKPLLRIEDAEDLTLQAEDLAKQIEEEPSGEVYVTNSYVVNCTSDGGNYVIENSYLKGVHICKNYYDTVSSNGWSNEFPTLKKLEKEVPGEINIKELKEFYGNYEPLYLLCILEHKPAISKNEVNYVKSLILTKNKFMLDSYIKELKTSFTQEDWHEGRLICNFKYANLREVSNNDF